MADRKWRCGLWQTENGAVVYGRQKMALLSTADIK